MKKRRDRSGPLVRKVAQLLRRLGVAGEGMVVALSGGPDSVALLRALLALRPPGTPLVLAHLNHLLRGAESDADEAFVRAVYARLTAEGEAALELRCERLEVAAQAQAEGRNLESVARRLRYDWLATVANEAGLRFVATGHTADDQAETVLHHLLRGTGLRGLRGIAARRPLRPGVEIVRPLLTATRAEVLAFLDALGQPYCHDSSNLLLDFTRNRLRHELLPLLAKQYNPAIASILTRLAEEADEVFRLEEAQASALLAETERPRAGALLIFDRARLAQARRHEIRAMFRLVWDRECWPADAMNFDAWDRLAGVALGEVTAVDLPDGVAARRLERVVQVGRRS